MLLHNFVRNTVLHNLQIPDYYVTKVFLSLFQEGYLIIVANYVGDISLQNHV